MPLPAQRKFKVVSVKSVTVHGSQLIDFGESIQSKNVPVKYTRFFF